MTQHELHCTSRESSSNKLKKKMYLYTFSLIYGYVNVNNENMKS